LARGDYQTAHGYRIYWVRSTQRAAQDAETRARRIERALAQLHQLQTTINTYQ